MEAFLWASIGWTLHYLGQAKFNTNQIRTVDSTRFHRTFEAFRFDASLPENSSLNNIVERDHEFRKQAYRSSA